MEKTKKTTVNLTPDNLKKMEEAIKTSGKTITQSEFVNNAIAKIPIIILGDGKLLIPDELLEVSVLLDVLRVFFNARLIGCFKEIVQLRPVNLSVRKECPQRFLGHRPQNLSLRLPRHAQIFRQLVHQSGLQPPHILRRLLPHQIPIPPVLRRIPDIRVR